MKVTFTEESDKAVARLVSSFFMINNNHLIYTAYTEQFMWRNGAVYEGSWSATRYSRSLLIA